MSIATQIQRLDTAKQQIKTSIEGKGVAVPDSATLSDYPQYIDQIESGGGGVTGAENLVNPQFNEWGLLKGDVVFKDNVTRIDKSYYQYNNDNIKTLSGNNVTYVAGSAFYGCSGLTKVDFHSLSDFGTYSFAECKSLKSIEIPEVVQFKTTNAFQNSGIEEVIFGDKLTSLSGTSNFNQCSSLTDVYIKSMNQVTMNTSNFFTGATSLQNIWVPCGMGDWYKSASNWSTYSSRIKEMPCYAAIVDDATEVPFDWFTLESSQLEQYKGSGRKVSVNASIKKIGNGAFSGWSSLKEVTLNGIYEFGDGVFDTYARDNVTMKVGSSVCDYYNSLQIENKPTIECFVEPLVYITLDDGSEEVIPKTNDSVVNRNTWGDYASRITKVRFGEYATSYVDSMFNNLPNLEEVDFTGFMGGNALNNTSPFNGINVKSLTIKGITHAAASYAFSSKYVESWYFPDLETLDGCWYAFSGCTAMKTLSVPKLKVINGSNSAFKGCTSIESLSFPALEEYKDGTSSSTSYLSGCTNLSEVYFGDKISTISASSTSYFGYQCKNLNTIKVASETPPSITSNFFRQITGNTGFTIYVPELSVDAYKTATNWSTYADNIQGYNFNEASRDDDDDELLPDED